MMTRGAILLVALALATAATAQTDDLLFSEYVEGTDANQALEIFNGTDATVDLSAYAVERYSNGSLVPVVIPLDAHALGQGDVFVLARTGFAAPALAQQFSADLNFSGNDALVLTHDGVPIDRIGRVGEDPGEFWSCAGGSTQNHTLRRLPSVCEGDTAVDAAFDPCLGWSFHPADSFDGLGAHLAHCGTVPAPSTRWGDVKALYR